MPIFEYRCKVCGEKFEKLVSNSKATEVTCPKCGSGEIRKLLSTFGYSSGSGFSSSVSSGSGCSGCSGGSCSTCH